MLSVGLLARTVGGIVDIGLVSRSSVSGLLRSLDGAALGVGERLRLCEADELDLASWPGGRVASLDGLPVR